MLPGKDWRMLWRLGTEWMLQRLQQRARLLGQRRGPSMHTSAQLPIRPSFSIALGASVAVTLPVFALRLVLAYVGSRIADWWLFWEYEIGVATLCFLIGVAVTSLWPAHRPRRAATLGFGLMVGGVAAHLAALRWMGYPPSALTSAFWLASLVGQGMLIVGLATWLARNHLESGA